VTFGELLLSLVRGGWSDATLDAGARAIAATAIAVATLAVSRYARRGIRGALKPPRINPEARVLIDRIVQVGVLIGGASWIADLYGLQLGALGAFLGISGVAVGLAVQDVLKQLIAGVYLMVERPFTVGDHVGLPAGQGVIRRTELLATIVDLTDGGVVVVPNAWFLSNAVVARSPGAPSRVRVAVTIRTSNPDVANAAALRVAVESCARQFAFDEDKDWLEVRVRGWGSDGPVVAISVISHGDRDSTTDTLAWTLRERFGQDLMAMTPE
jgi:small-conductance mechanosensitive channel